jgi:hypothetical protein
VGRLRGSGSSSSVGWLRSELGLSRVSNEPGGTTITVEYPDPSTGATYSGRGQVSGWLKVRTVGAVALTAAMPRATSLAAGVAPMHVPTAASYRKDRSSTI